LEIGNLERNFDLEAAMWCNNIYQYFFASLNDPPNRWHSHVLFQIQLKTWF
jgi:hypothetical protein